MIKLSASAYVAPTQVETIIIDPSGKSPEVVVVTLSGKEFRIPMADQAKAEHKALEIAQAIVAFDV
jgi:hypothetical protein